MKILYGFVILIFAFSIVSCDSKSESNSEGINNKQGNKTGIKTRTVKNSKSADKKKKPYELPKMKFEETTLDFGKIIQGEKIAVDYNFVNNGKSELIITKVSTSCGCTVGNYPRHAIFPGKSGKIEVVFDSKGKKGFQNKTVTILANTEPNYTKLQIKGIIVVPEKN